MTRTSSDLKHEILLAIQEFFRVKRHSPTLREIGLRVGM